jgi:hypothetical protein
MTVMKRQNYLQKVVPDSIFRNVLSTLLRRVDHTSQVSSTAILGTFQHL